MTKNCYIMSPQIALRSWQYVPHAFYIKGDETAHGLKKEEFEILLQCNGSTVLEENETVRSLLSRGFISPCKEGEATLSPWQEYMFCDNRYMPKMNLMITGKCNYNCLHCFNAADNAPLNSEFSMEEMEKLLDEARDCGVNALTITGGEPMLHKHFHSIMEGIYHRGMYVFELNTNGVFITEESLEKMKSLGALPLIKISFDGIGYHDWMRNRKGAEEDALRAIALSMEKGFRVKVQMNMNRKNADSILPSLKLLDKMGVEVTRVIYTTSAPRWEQNAAGQTMDLEEYYDRALEIAGEYLGEGKNMWVNFWQYLTVFPKTKSYAIDAVAAKEDEFRGSAPRCKGARGMIAVSANGEVYPCLQMSGWMEAHGISYGNVKTEGLKPLLQSSRYMEKICLPLSHLQAVNPKCGGCEFFKYCTGGCPALGTLLDGNDGELTGSDLAKCIFYKKGYYKKITAALSPMKNRSFVGALE